MVKFVKTHDYCLCRDDTKPLSNSSLENQTWLTQTALPLPHACAPRTQLAATARSDHQLLTKRSTFRFQEFDPEVGSKTRSSCYVPSGHAFSIEPIVSNELKSAGPLSWRRHRPLHPQLRTTYFALESKNKLKNVLEIATGKKFDLQF